MAERYWLLGAVYHKIKQNISSDLNFLSVCLAERNVRININGVFSTLFSRINVQSLGESRMYFKY